ncbi:LLM class flavin-dependent oxidoreductase [Candidatus Entotheonella palauensis]|uniref:Luciferase-like domain-containing protein n=1 Tax=Candidatus Entotheonella gemina TaxID=1429439 RepID=W4LCD8_9BACT|nr:LLM class flavin-dependent oxidoreductase [Candidatus Entotheonella palauensis]ETW95753.1 MAG: hypothetical protein ETSY2_47620 [Candidatus Entotheonella gemina]
MAEFWRVSFPVPGQSENMAQSAEQDGWDGLYFPDTQCLSGDIYSAMCLAAKATQQLKVGTAVTNPVTRHPSVTASAIATVQVESDGRAVLGIGRGDSSLAYIGQRPAPVLTLETYLGQVQCYLRGEPVDIDGYSSQNMWIHMIGQPKVPVDVAATGPRVISLGARMAERLTFAVGADAARIRSAIDLAKTARAAAGLNPDDLSFGAYVNVACDDDIKRARAIIKGSVGTFAHFTGMSAANSEGLPDAAIYRHIGANYDMANHARGAAGHMQSVPDEFVSRFAVTGNASYCVNRLGELIALGLDRLVLLTGSGDSHSDHTAASMERLASDVLPQLR